MIYPRKFLLLTNQLEQTPTGGRQLLCKLNHDILKEIYDDKLLVFELPKIKIIGFKAFINSFKGNIDGLNVDVINNILQKIHTENVSDVFIDGSNLGEFANVLKQRFSRVKISIFFHNVEARFFFDIFRLKKSLRALAVLTVNYLSERKAVLYGDKLVCLNERDSRLLKKIYGRRATHISAMALEDKLPVDYALSKNVTKKNFALFVGGAFYANQTGIAWFVKHVVPKIDIKVCIVGKGFEDFKHDFDLDGKVEVIGEVDNLAEWYLGAHFVIAPIFKGSGMKTKIAEAIMFGKKIIGTPEAFSGYEDVIDQIGWMCKTANDFVNAIYQAKNLIEHSFDPSMRNIYEKKYSYQAARERFRAILLE